MLVSIYISTTLVNNTTRRRVTVVTRVVKEAYSPNVVEEASSEVGIAPVLCQAAFLCTHKGVRIQAYIRKPIAPREGYYAH